MTPARCRKKAASTFPSDPAGTTRCRGRSLFASVSSGASKEAPGMRHHAAAKRRGLVVAAILANVIPFFSEFGFLSAKT